MVLERGARVWLLLGVVAVACGSDGDDATGGAAGPSSPAGAAGAATAGQAGGSGAAAASGGTGGGAGSAASGGSGSAGTSGGGGKGGATSAGAAGTGASGGGTPESACVAHAAALCAWNDRCIPATWTEHCANEGAARCQQERALPDTGLSDADLMLCATALLSAPCGFLPAVCTAKPKGSRADGGACLHGAQCASGYCKGSPSSCGVCAPRAKVGAACVTEECEEDAYCGADGPPVGGPQTFHCKAYTKAGASCDMMTPCEPGTVCNLGVCALPPEVGSPCSFACKDAVCKGGTCAPYAQQGEACGSAECAPFVGQPQTTSFLTCGDGPNPTCVLPKLNALGEACGPNPWSSSCAPGAVCKPKFGVGVCALPRGASCDPKADECGTDTCVVGPGGAACTDTQAPPCDAACDAGHGCVGGRCWASPLPPCGG